MTDHLDERTFNLLFAVRRSVRYHNHRRRFYEIWNATTVTIGVLGGSSAATGIIATMPQGWEFLPAISAAMVAVFSALDLAIGTAKRGNSHADLARKFIGLEKLFAHGRILEDQEHEDIIRDRLEIEAGEPTPLRLLDAMCHYELLRSMGDIEKHPVVPLWRRMLIHWISQNSYAQSLAPTQ